MKKIAIVVLLGGALLGTIWYLEQPSDGVEPVVWNEATCAHCKMHIGDRRFAAQLQTKTGEVHNFDDPGCVFEWIEDQEPRIEQVYFRHYREDRWLGYQKVGFVRIDEPTPMGYGLAAVEKVAHEDAMSFSEASNAVLSGEIEPTSAEE